MPSADGLQQAGVDYLYLAVQQAIEIGMGDQLFSDPPEFSAVRDSGLEEYIAATLRQRSTCVLLLFTAIEFLLKARIASVSPYLLLDSPNTWPKPDSEGQIHFDDMRTVAANQLIRVANTVTNGCLDDRFQRLFNKLRKQRNALIHAGSNRVTPTPEQIITDALSVAEHLIGPMHWLSIHRDHAQAPPQVWHDD